MPAAVLFTVMFGILYRYRDHFKMMEDGIVEEGCELEAEFEGYRKILPTNKARRAFDELIERLLSQHGVDYVRGYVDALKDAARGAA